MEKYIVQVATIISILLNACFVMGEPGVSLSIQNAVERALQHSEEVRLQEESMKKLYNTYREVRAGAFPQIKGEVGLDNYIKSPVLRIDMGDGETEIPLKREWDFKAGATLTQILLAFGKVNTAIDIARKALDIEKILVHAAKKDITAATKKTYFTVLFAKESVAIAEESRENALENKRALRERVRSGRSSRMENIKIEADVAGRIPVVLDAQKKYAQIMISFKNLIGLTFTDTTVLSDVMTDAFPEYTFASAREQMMGNDPVLVSLKRAVELRGRIVDLKRSDFFPTLSGFASYNYAGNGDALLSYNELQSEVIAGLRLNLTLWDSGILSNAYRQSVNDRLTAELEYQKMLERRDVELASKIDEYGYLVQEYAANKNMLELALQSYEITLSSFRSGGASLSVLNDAELYLTGSKIMTLSTLYAIHTVIVDIELLTAGDSL